MCFHVFSNPGIHKRLLHEVNSAGFPGRGSAALRTLSQLPFLNSTIMEGLRLSPGVATRMARIAPDRDLFYKDWRIPAGTPVGMTTILMHTDEETYPDRNAFRPERWIDDIDFRKDLEHHYYAPFSRGTRMCIGMQWVLSPSYRHEFHLTRVDIASHGPSSISRLQTFCRTSLLSSWEQRPRISNV